MNKLTLDKVCTWAFITYLVLFGIIALNTHQVFFHRDNFLIAGLLTPFMLIFGYICVIIFKLVSILHEKLFNR